MHVNDGAHKLNTQRFHNMYITVKSIMFDVDDCPPLPTLSSVNALLASRAETKTLA